MQSDQMDFFGLLDIEFSESRDNSLNITTKLSQTKEDLSRRAYNRDGSRRLEDFGESLGNTRKNRKLFSAKGELNEEILRERLTTEPLSKVWPVKDILELYKTQPEGAAFLYLLRKKIQDKKSGRNTNDDYSYIETAAFAVSLSEQLKKYGSKQLETKEFFDRLPSAAVFDLCFGLKGNYRPLSLIDARFWEQIEVTEYKFNFEYAENCIRRFAKNGEHEFSGGIKIGDHPFFIQVPFPGRSPVRLTSEGKVIEDNFVYADSIEELKQKLNACFEKALSKPENAEAKKTIEKPVQLFGKYYCGSSEYEIWGKQGSVQLRIEEKTVFNNKTDFLAYLQANDASLKDRFRELRKEFSMEEKDWRAQSPIRGRIGDDYRKGFNVTPEMFQQTFGFRGVEFGNWVKQGKAGRERQWMLNNAYDALNDLAKILGIPPKAVSLNGSLGLCFGSRGRGSASAHYDSQDRIINLTKTKGYSSLAHEWFHALDHFLARNIYKGMCDESRFLSDKAESRAFELSAETRNAIRKEFSDYNVHPDFVKSIEKLLLKHIDFERLKTQDNFELELNVKLSKAYYGLPFKYTRKFTKKDLAEKQFDNTLNIRPELFHKWGETIEAIRSSAMGGRMEFHRPYWKSKIEEAARSFEGFIESKSRQMGIRNDFLTNNACSEQPVAKNSFYPYLDGEDVQKISRKFTELFSELKIKETEKGIELYSKSHSEPPKTPKSDIREVLIKAFGKDGLVRLVNNDKFYLVQSEKDAFMLAGVRQKMKNGFTDLHYPSGSEHVSGLYDNVNHTSYLVADNLTVETAVPVFLHEIGVHMAHDSQLREKTRVLIDSAVRLYEDGLAQKDPLMQRVEKRLTEDARVSRSSGSYREEVCGYLIEEAAKENQKKPAVVRWFNEIKSGICVWLVKHGVRDTSCLEVQDLVTIAKANVQEVSKLPKVYELSSEGKKVLSLHVQALSERYSKIEDARKEIESLYQQFSELERAGKPLPQVPQNKKPEINR